MTDSLTGTYDGSSFTRVDSAEDGSVAKDDEGGEEAEGEGEGEAKGEAEVGAEEDTYGDDDYTDDAEDPSKGGSESVAEAEGGSVVAVPVPPRGCRYAGCARPGQGETDLARAPHARARHVMPHVHRE